MNASHRSRVTGLVALLGLACHGCSPDAPLPGEFPAREPPLDGGTVVPLDGGGPSSGALDPSGTWLFWSETDTCVMTMGLQLEVVASALSLVQLHDEGGGLVRHEQRFCLQQQTPVLGLQTSTSVQVAESIPAASWYGLLDGDQPGDAYHQQEHVHVWAAHLEDPVNELLPTSPDDPRVYDMDGDGQPGATLVLGDNLCQMYVVQRGRQRWAGRIVSPVRIEGGGASTSEQNVLDATSGFCTAHYDVRYIEPNNRFVLLRVDGRHGALDLDADGDGEVSCAEVRDYGLAPFAPRTPDDDTCKE